MWWKPRAAQNLVVEVVEAVGEVTKKYRVEVPKNTPLDDVEALLMIVGAIPPRVTGSPGEFRFHQNDASGAPK